MATNERKIKDTGPEIDLGQAGRWLLNRGKENLQTVEKLMPGGEKATLGEVIQLGGDVLTFVPGVGIVAGGAARAGLLGARAFTSATARRAALDAAKSSGVKKGLLSRSKAPEAPAAAQPAKTGKKVTKSKTGTQPKTPTPPAAGEAWRNAGEKMGRGAIMGRTTSGRLGRIGVGSTAAWAVNQPEGYFFGSEEPAAGDTTAVNPADVGFWNDPEMGLIFVTQDGTQIPMLAADGNWDPAAFSSVNQYVSNF